MRTIDPSQRERLLKDELMFEDGMSEHQAQEHYEKTVAKELPILTELDSLGIHVLSVWDLCDEEIALPDEAVLGIIRHMGKSDYTGITMDGMSHALVYPRYKKFWHQFREGWITAITPDSADAFARIIGLHTNKGNVAEVIDLMKTRRDESQIFWLRPIVTFGGDQGRELVRELRSDPILKAEASALVR